jgi:SPW repeat
MSRWRRESILDLYNLIVGIFLFASPWLLASTHGVMGEDARVSGLVVVSLSVAALIAFAEWEEWGLFIIGFALAASPWVLGFQNTTAMKFNVGIGLFVAYLAALELWLIHYYPPSPRVPH